MTTLVRSRVLCDLGSASCSHRSTLGSPLDAWSDPSNGCFEIGLMS
jgi:hypothetical protein